jgi:DNA-binding MarR family transcriptional regulator
LRYIGGVDHSSLDHDVLKALAQFPERTPVHARELAAELGEAVQSVPARLQPLISAGLVSKHWGAPLAPARTYMITEDGRDYLARAEEPRKIVKHAAERLHR